MPEHTGTQPICDGEFWPRDQTATPASRALFSPSPYLGR